MNGGDKILAEVHLDLVYVLQLFWCLLLLLITKSKTNLCLCHIILISTTFSRQWKYSLSLWEVSQGSSWICCYNIMLLSILPYLSFYFNVNPFACNHFLLGTHITQNWEEKRNTCNNIFHGKWKNNKTESTTTNSMTLIIKTRSATNTFILKL